MDKSTNKLLQEFNKISKKGWIKSISNNPRNFGNIGITFEKELNKERDTMYFPDYYGIEIKCTSKFSKYPLYLFTVAFDGPTFPEINRIIETYGYYDKDFKDKKVLFEILNCSNKKVVNKNYKFRFEIDYKEEKLYLCVYNLNNELIEKKSFVYLDTIKNHLLLKLNTLALIKASKKQENNQLYFKYYEMTIYKLKDFDTFLELLNKGKIEISLISRIGKSGKEKGKYNNKNLVFHIKKNEIPLLFQKIT